MPAFARHASGNRREEGLTARPPSLTCCTDRARLLSRVRIQRILLTAAASWRCTEKLPSRLLSGYPEQGPVVPEVSQLPLAVL